ncbi:hypothetical protein ACV229_37840 [Burkholderia sp. MR1-5-21]
MASIYAIVRSALTTYHPLELQALGEDKEELISQFIFLKVFRLEAVQPEAATFPLHSAPSNRHAVCAYFRRYLIDCLRHAGHQRNVPIDDALHEIERQVALPVDAIEAALLPHGLDESCVRESARAFIDGLDDADRLVLAGSLGWLSDEKGGLSQVAAQYRIASYHYRAAKLGVTLKKHAQPADFARTAIGQWIERTLGIDIAPDNRAAILAVLGILSAQSRGPA